MIRTIYYYYGAAPFVTVGIAMVAFIISNRHLKSRLEVIESKRIELNKKLQNTIEKLENEKKEKILVNKKLSQVKETLKIKEAELDERNACFEKIMTDNLQAMPYLAGLMADYLTYDIEVLAKKLDWGFNQQREKKVQDIRTIRKNAMQRIEMSKVAEYQLGYLKQLYPEIEEIVDTKYDELKRFDLLEEADGIYDNTRYYLSDDEWRTLTETEINQLALDRYVESHKKSKWQIGRDYELYVGYSMYERYGIPVEYYGSKMKLEDFGRDLIIVKQNDIDIVQCKFWGKDKVIREKHIFQLYGTSICYELENKSGKKVNPVFVTNIKLSSEAYSVANRLGVKVIENYELGNFPRIKCNINHDDYGLETRIYHLPMDQQYDNVIINKKKGEFFAMTVSEAERAGFRRAYKWKP